MKDFLSTTVVIIGPICTNVLFLEGINVLLAVCILNQFQAYWPLRIEVKSDTFLASRSSSEINH